MKKVTAREYARQRKISLFQVIKKIQKGELRGEQIEENGLKIQYVLLDTEEPERKESKRNTAPEEAAEESNGNPLLREMQKLREEIAELKQLVKRCCPQN